MSSIYMKEAGYEAPEAVRWKWVGQGFASQEAVEAVVCPTQLRVIQEGRPEDVNENSRQRSPACMGECLATALGALASKGPVNLEVAGAHVPAKRCARLVGGNWQVEGRTAGWLCKQRRPYSGGSSSPKGSTGRVNLKWTEIAVCAQRIIDKASWLCDQSCYVERMEVEIESMVRRRRSMVYVGESYFRWNRIEGT